MMILVISLKILLSADLENYKNAVIASGGEVGKENCDGLILCGGGDISPTFYGEKNIQSQNIDYNNDLYEFSLLNQFVQLKKPVLGICRGMQIINVFFGGTLYQHIDNHKNSDGTDLFHTISVKSSFLYDLYGKSFTVNSCHHQAVNKLGNDLSVMAHSGEIIEGICHKTLPIIGVQWHPERIENGKKLFDYFIRNLIL